MKQKDKKQSLHQLNESELEKELKQTTQSISQKSLQSQQSQQMNAHQSYNCQIDETQPNQKNSQMRSGSCMLLYIDHRTYFNVKLSPNNIKINLKVINLVTSVDHNHSICNYLIRVLEKFMQDKLKELLELQIIDIYLQVEPLSNNDQ